MKELFKYKITLFVLVCWVLFSIVGFLRRDTIYKNYTADIKGTPYFVYVLWGLHDNIYPWTGEDTSSRDVLAAQKDQENMPNGNNESIFVTEETETQTDTEESQESQQENDTEQEKASQQENDTEESQESQQEEEAEGASDTELEPENVTPFIDVDLDYFDDAVFVGDSRTVGLDYYGGLDNATFYATKGMNVYDLWTDAFCELDGRNVTLEEALSARQYKKVYFQIGINEMGTGTVETFMDAYKQTVEKLKELQPNAIIYIQGIMRVTKLKSDNDAIYNNEGINVRNSEIEKLADGERIFYIDVNDVVCDDTGALDANLTFDNLHLYATEYPIWVDYLKTKGINLD